MNERQKEILRFVIQEYIRSAQPVGSSLLTQKAGMDLSAATYRNELAALESEGYLEQPHTSAGRVPTQKAYQLYVDQFLMKKEYKPKSREDLKLAIKKDLAEDAQLREVAKQLVEKCDQAVILAFDKNNIFYTGLSNLFSKPEFEEHGAVLDISKTVDQIDRVIGEVFDRIDDVQVLIGSDNPFGSSTSSIVGKYKLKDGKEGMFAILGPMRMDYDKNVHLLQEVKQLVERIDKKE
jgi:heat-inducible transcriptional repressor